MDRCDPAWLREQANRCRRMASCTTDEHIERTLEQLSCEYEREAVALETSAIAKPIPDSNEQPDV